MPRRTVKTVARRRLTPEQRRDEILDVGLRVFSRTGYEDVTMEEVAQQAGVSRALAYHYFPSKKDLFAALWARAHEQLLSAVVFDADAPLRAQIRAGVVAHFTFYQRNLPLVLIANRSAIAVEPVVRDPIAADLAEVRERIVAALGLTGRRRALAEAGLAGWTAFVREVALEWLEKGRISRAQAVDLCMAALDAALGADAPT
jgi:AcrR family transcriptional regulator